MRLAMYTFSLKNGWRPHPHHTVPSCPKTVMRTGSTRVMFRRVTPACACRLPPAPNTEFLSRARTTKATSQLTRVAREWKRRRVDKRGGGRGSARRVSMVCVSMGSVEARPENTAVRILLQNVHGDNCRADYLLANVHSKRQSR